DLPDGELDGRTALQAASTTHLDRLARHGRISNLGWDRPDGWSEPDVWAALAGAPVPVALARGPLEASALEVPLEARDLAFSAPILTGTVERVAGTVGWFAPQELNSIVESLRPLWSRRWRWMAEPGAAVLRWTDGVGRRLSCTSPSDMIGQSLVNRLPEGDSAEELARLIWDSAEILDNHPVNRRRLGEGWDPLLALWPWGGGAALVLPEQVPGGWSAIATEPAFLGLARALGMRCRPLDASADLETALRARVDAVQDRLHRGDRVVWTHVVRRGGAMDTNLAEIEAIDRDWVGELLRWSENQTERLLWRVVWNGPKGTVVLDSDPLADPTGRLPFDGRGFDESRAVVSSAGLWRRHTER
ncbi:MAG: hypothetical protein ACOVT5_14705, partial [Armatimonadaceae bacterium]